MSNPTTRRILEIGGIVSGLILIAFGAVAIYMGFDGRSTVGDNLAAEFIVGSDDMNATQIAEDIADVIRPNQERIAKDRADAGVEPIEFTPLKAPTCDVAGKTIDNGTKAFCFAKYVRLHALRSASGLTYSQSGSTSPPTTRRLQRRTSPAARNAASRRSTPRRASLSTIPMSTSATATALSSALNLAHTAGQIALSGS
jgi:hypothetical protein